MCASVHVERSAATHAPASALVCTHGCARLCTPSSTPSRPRTWHVVLAAEQQQRLCVVPRDRGRRDDGVHELRGLQPLVQARPRHGDDVRPPRRLAAAAAAAAAGVALRPLALLLPLARLAGRLRSTTRAAAGAIGCSGCGSSWVAAGLWCRAWRSVACSDSISRSVPMHSLDATTRRRDGDGHRPPCFDSTPTRDARSPTVPPGYSDRIAQRADLARALPRLPCPPPFGHCALTRPPAVSPSLVAMRASCGSCGSCGVARSSRSRALLAASGACQRAGCVR